MGSVVERRMDGMRARIDSRSAAEDAYVDAMQGISTKDPTG